MTTRREVLKASLALPLAGSTSAFAQERPVYLSDMHFHSFFGESKYHSRPVGKFFADGRATLVSWSVSGDAPWFGSNRERYRQHSEPKPGEALRWVQRQIGHIKAHMAEQGLKPVLRPDDVDKALAGEPHVVLTVEGTPFIEDVAHVRLAYDLGIRHLQPIHFTRNPFGDFQTSPPTHNRLTTFGGDIVAECNRLGILVDLAHSTPATVAGALAIARVPPIWSHGSVTTGPKPHPALITWKARQLPLETARAIARKGGVVGLWVLSVDVGKTPEAYGARVLQLADWLGDDHAAFGTDTNGLGQNFTFATYADLRRVVDGWRARRVPPQRIRKLASENYARVLKQAMSARQA